MQSPAAERRDAVPRQAAASAVPASVLDRARGALLGTIVGDVLGMPYEGAPAHEIPASLEMEEARLGRGTFTGDPQMMTALAESLLRCDAIDDEDLASTFRAHFDPRRGYGVAMANVIGLWEHGVPVHRAAGFLFGGAGTLGNEAAVRVAPVAVRFLEDEVLLATQARRSARVTHAHPLGIDGAAVQAAAIAAALDDEDPLQAALAAARSENLRQGLVDLASTCATSLSPATLRDRGTGVGSSAPASVPVAVVAASRAASFEEAVTVAVRCGGDVDSLGAMAGAIAGARFGADAISSRWLDALEDGDRGRRHVERLATDLATRAHIAVSLDVRRPAH